MITRLLLALLLAAPTVSLGQPAPLHETRGVWLTTNWALDWPPSGGAAFQEQRLREIIRNIKALGMNTVIFQVLFQGAAMYPSERLPWSSFLTGSPGKDPGFDPLAVAIDEAHRIGLELHAWVNVFHVASASANISLTAEPVHVRFAHPEWVVEHTDGSFWGNPAIPEFRDWHVENVLEIVRNYDVDAVHFDYMRYPEKNGLDGDAAIMANYPNGAGTLAQWRRENVNAFVRQVHGAVRAEKPWVKVGASPIGAYRWFPGAPPGHWGFDDVYQETHRWLNEDLLDYVAPMLYFNIGNDPIPPNTYQSQDFQYWVTNWVANSNGRHVYAGQGTWLEVADRRFAPGEIAEQIVRSRNLGARGQVQFRYAHTTGNPFGGHYARPSLPPPMPWHQSAAAPSAPSVTIHHEPGSLEIRLAWTPATAAVDDPLRRYAVFRKEGGSPDVGSAEDLFAIVGPRDSTFVDAYDFPPEVPVEYQIISQSLLGFTSDGSNVVSTADTSVGTEIPVPRSDVSLSAPYPNPSTGAATISFTLKAPAEVTMRLYDLLGRNLANLADGLRPEGEHRIEIDGSGLSAGVYLIEMQADDARYRQRLTIVR
jgi:uncharacterized lipoprotein YddW (UPF0748 family)